MAEIRTEYLQNIIFDYCLYEKLFGTFCFPQAGLYVVCNMHDTLI
jgi:hypothetical protein